MTDPFAPPPHRPSHPDFMRLSEIVLQLDGVAVESGIPAGEVLPHEVGKHADVDSVVYMAVMRAIKAKEESGISGVAQVVASAMWLDGWIAGVRFQQRYRDPELRKAAERLSDAWSAHIEDSDSADDGSFEAFIDTLAALRRALGEEEP